MEKFKRLYFYAKSKNKNVTRGDNKSSVESKTTREDRVKTSSSRENLGPELERADLHRNPSN